MDQPTTIEEKTSSNNETNWEDYLRAYYDKPQSNRTWSGYDVKEIYTPKDLADKNYEENIADAGDFPYTRGIHRNMFRGRFWTRREVVGIGSPADTNQRATYCFEKGGSGLNTIADITYEMGLDPDHPLAQKEVGLTGVNISSMNDMETLAGDIPLDKVSWSLITASTVAAVTMAQYVAVAQKKGYVTKRDEIPTRIDEKQKGSEDYIGSSDSEPELIAKRELVQDTINSIATDRQKLSDSEAERASKQEEKNLLIEKRIEREGELKTDTSAVQTLIDEKARIIKELADSAAEIQKDKQSLASVDFGIKGAEESLKQKQISLGDVRNNYLDIKAESQQLQDNPPSEADNKICPAGPDCPFANEQAQTLSDKVTRHTKALELKESRRAELGVFATRLKAEVQKIRQTLDEQTEFFNAGQAAFAEAELLHDELKDATDKRRIAIDEILTNRPKPDFTKDDKWNEISAAIDKCQTDIGQPVTTQLAQLQVRQQRADSELAELNKSLANIDQIEKDKARVEELQEEQRDVQEQTRTILLEVAR